MLKYTKRPVLSLILLAFSAAGLMAQKFVYTNNDLAAGNTVSAFSVLVNGSLGLIASYPTGGAGTGGGFYSSNRILVVGDFLYAANAGSKSVSGFTIDPDTGVLTSVGPPVETAGANNATFSGMSLAATPDAKYLYAGTTDGNITIFSINPSTGVLTELMTGSPAVAGGAMSSMEVSPNGKYLAVALYYPTNELAVFAIQSDGTLVEVSESPFVRSSGTDYMTGIDINCASTLLFAGRNGPEIDVFNIASNGVLSELSSSPFSTGNVLSNQVVLLSPDDSTLFSSNQGGNAVTAFTVSPGGGITVPGTTVSAGSSALYPGGLAVSKDGTFLYAADTNGAISTFGVGGSSPLSFDSYFSSGLTSGLHSLAAYPAKVCASPPTPDTLSASLQIYTVPPLGFDLEATLALDSSLIVDPLTQAVTIQIRSFTSTMPKGSFRLFQQGKKAGTYVFRGAVDGSRLVVQITPLGQNQFQIIANDKKADLAGLATSTTVTVGIGGNSASTSVSPGFGRRRHGDSPK